MAGLPALLVEQDPEPVRRVQLLRRRNHDRAVVAAPHDRIETAFKEAVPMAMRPVAHEPPRRGRVRRSYELLERWVAAPLPEPRERHRAAQFHLPD